MASNIQINIETFTLFTQVFGPLRYDQEESAKSLTTVTASNEIFKAVVGYNEYSNLFGNNKWYKQLTSGIFTGLGLPFAVGKCVEFSFKYLSLCLQSWRQNLKQYAGSDHNNLFSRGSAVILGLVAWVLKKVMDFTGFVLGAIFSPMKQFKALQISLHTHPDGDQEYVKKLNYKAVCSAALSITFYTGLIVLACLIPPVGLSLLAKIGLPNIFAGAPIAATFAAAGVVASGTVARAPVSMFSKPIRTAAKYKTDSIDNFSDDEGTLNYKSTESDSDIQVSEAQNDCSDIDMDYDYDSDRSSISLP